MTEKIFKEEKKMKKQIKNLLLTVSVSILFLASWKIISIMLDYRQDAQIYQQANQKYVTNKQFQDVQTEENNESEEPGMQAEHDNWYEMVAVDLEELQKENSDIVGWLYFEAEEISYPILYSGDNETYLHTAYNKKTAAAGSIFLDGNNAPDFSDHYNIIYGHNMKDLSMFGRLKFYRTKEDYYETHKYFQIIIKDRYDRYCITEYKEVAASDAVYELTEEKKRALSETLVLSTCTSGENRFILHAIKTDTWKRENDK